MVSARKIGQILTTFNNVRQSTHVKVHFSWKSLYCMKMSDPFETPCKSPPQIYSNSKRI